MAEQGRAAAYAAYAGADVAVGLRPEHLGHPLDGPGDRPRLHGRVKFVEQLGAESMVQIELDAKPVAADDAVDLPGRAVVTARFDAHADVGPGDLAEVAVRTERLQYFDLTTGRAIR